MGVNGMGQGRILYNEKSSSGFIKYKEKNLSDRLPVHLVILSYGIGLILITITNSFLLNSGLGFLIIFLILFVIFLLIRRDYLKLRGVIVYESGILTSDDEFIHFKGIESVTFNKRWFKSRLNVVMFKPKDRGSEEFREFQKYYGLVIDRSQFKDINKFREMILPLLEKYQIKIIDKFL